MEAKVLELVNDDSLAVPLLDYAKTLVLDNDTINYLNYNLSNFEKQYETNIYFYNHHFKLSNSLDTDSVSMRKVIHLAKIIASDKIKVTVFCNIIKPSIWNCKLSNPRYLHYGEFNCSPNPDKLIYVDSYDFATGRDKCNNVYFMCNERIGGNLTFLKCLTRTFFTSKKALEMYKEDGNKLDDHKLININHDSTRDNTVCYIRASKALDAMIYDSPHNIKLLSNMDDGKFKGETIIDRRKQNQALLTSRVCVYDGTSEETKKRITSRGCVLLSNNRNDNDQRLSLSDGLNRSISILLRESVDNSNNFLSLL